ncbi:MAG: YbaB/EbfC family nucleoid-associated protein [Lentisphaerae bacterium]|nr:YbaB/EbfC family nucleoid-associated protein [Lentisphaerota bacterium]
MFGSLGEMANMIKKAKEIQKNMAAMKEEMARTEFSASSPDQEVVVVVSGDFQIKNIKIASSIAGNENLGSIVTATTNSALAAAKSAMQSKMQEITGGLNIPGLF